MKSNIRILGRTVIALLCAALMLGAGGCSSEPPLITPMPAGYVTIAPVTDAPTQVPTEAPTSAPTDTGSPENTTPGEFTSLDYAGLVGVNTNAKRTAAGNVLKASMAYPGTGAAEDVWLMASEDGYMVCYTMAGGALMYAVNDFRFMQAGDLFLQVIDLYAAHDENAVYLARDMGIHLDEWGEPVAASFAEGDLGYSVSYTLTANAAASALGVKQGDLLTAAFDLDESLLTRSMTLTSPAADGVTPSTLLSITYDYASSLAIPEQVVSMLKSEETYPVTLRMNGIQGFSDMSVYIAKGATLGVNSPADIRFYYDAACTQIWTYSDGPITDALTLYARVG